MEEVASAIVRHFYEQFRDPESGQPIFSLVRFFKTHAWERLSPSLREFARRALGAEPSDPQMPCLTLLATVGEQPEWNTRSQSKGHQAIPLASEQSVMQAPMIVTLLKQMGVQVKSVLKPDPTFLLDWAQKTFNVFHVPDAPGSPYILGQQEFVLPFHIKSVLGFGGILPAGSLFALVMFSKRPITRDVADLFKPLALNVKIAVLPFEDQVFA